MLARGAGLAVAFAIAAAPAALWARPAHGGSPTAKAATIAAQRPNIWGVWMGLGAGAKTRFKPTGYDPRPELTAWGKVESERLASPNTPGQCDVWNPVSFMLGSGLFPLQILDGGNQIVMFQEAVMQPRRIYTDGRRLESDLDPTWLGHSIGQWEGDTLVVDTKRMNGRERPLNGYVSGAVTSGVEAEPRLPSTDQARIVERIRLVEPDILEDAFTVEDSKAFLKPFRFTRYFQRRPDIDVQEYVCVDNSRIEEEGQNRR